MLNHLKWANIPLLLKSFLGQSWGEDFITFPMGGIFHYPKNMKENLFGITSTGRLQNSIALSESPSESKADF